MPKTLEEIAREMLAYEREDFEQDRPLDLADLCSAFGRWRYELKRALGLELTGAELSYDPEFTAKFGNAYAAGYDVEPDGFDSGWIARDPDGVEIEQKATERSWPTERGAWQACEDHRRDAQA